MFQNCELMIPDRLQNFLEHFISTKTSTNYGLPSADRSSTQNPSNNAHFQKFHYMAIQSYLDYIGTAVLWEISMDRTDLQEMRVPITLRTRRDVAKKNNDLGLLKCYFHFKVYDGLLDIGMSGRTAI